MKKKFKCKFMKEIQFVMFTINEFFGHEPFIQFWVKASYPAPW